MNDNYIFEQIASKADYIADLARDAMYQREIENETIGIVDNAKLEEVLHQLENIADTVEEYHTFGD